MNTIAAELTADLRIDLLTTMIRIRQFEDAVGEMHLRGLTAGSMLHLSVGEEATSAGIGRAMTDGDYFTTHHRGHGIFIARGADLGKMMAEIFGRSGGYCRGKGGSMHIADIHLGHMGANAIVGGNIPIAVGGGFTLKYLRKHNASVAFFGDGALNQGVLYESMNMAALWKLPVMFAVVNNQYGMGTRIDHASASLEFAKRAESFGLRAVEIDGMDVEEVWGTAADLLAYARNGGGPVFLLSNTYRFYGHGRKDPSPYRSKDEEDEWKARDPIPVFRERLSVSAALSDDEYERIRAGTKIEVERAVEFAKSSPLPKPDQLSSDVFTDQIVGAE